MSDIIIEPRGGGYIPEAVDPRRADWNKLIGATIIEAAPSRFDRGNAIWFPVQGANNCCVPATGAFYSAYKSYQERKAGLKISFRYPYAKTPGGTGGRNYTDVFNFQRDIGFPEERYCPNDISLTPAEFLNVSITPEGLDNAQNYRLKNWSWVNTDLESLRRACLRDVIYIAIPGNNADWKKPIDQVITFSGKIDWYHSIALWDWEQTYLRIANWWGDNFRKLSNDYPIEAALSPEDLPDNWRALQNNMELIKLASDNKIYLLNSDGVIRYIPSADSFESYFGKGAWPKVRVAATDEFSKYAVGKPLIKEEAVAQLKQIVGQL